MIGVRDAALIRIALALAVLAEQQGPPLEVGPRPVASCGCPSSLDTT
jgi:hypothetical protein